MKTNINWKDLILEHEDKTADAFKRTDRTAHFYPDTHFSVYLWSDGDLTVKMEPAGSNSGYSSDADRVLLMRFCYQGREWYCNSTDPLADLIDASTDYPAERAAWDKWKKFSQNFDTEPSYWDCIDFWQDTDTWDEVEERYIDRAINGVDYANLVSTVLKDIDK